MYEYRYESCNRKKVNITLRNLDPSQYTINNNFISFDVQSTDGGPDSLYTHYDENSCRSPSKTNYLSNIEFIIKHLDWSDDDTNPRFFHEAIFHEAIDYNMCSFG